MPRSLDVRPDGRSTPPGRRAAGRDRHRVRTAGAGEARHGRWVRGRAGRRGDRDRGRAATAARTCSRCVPASAGSSVRSSRRAPPAASRTARSRWLSPGPSNCRATRARRRYRCASCSQVKPMPPSTWMQSLAQEYAASSAVPAARAATRPRTPALSSTARAASHASTRACSTRTSMSAHRCLIPWNCPMGRPNCSRTFAYSAAVCSAQAAVPHASAANSTHARSRTSAAVHLQQPVPGHRRPARA